MKYFFWSDPHFFHKNIIRYSNRPFQTVEEMNEVIIQRHNERVKNGDMSFCMGDWSFHASKNAEHRGEGSPVKGLTLLERLNGNIIRIKGNHDKVNNRTFTPVFSMTLMMGGLKIQLIHRPEDSDLSHDLILHGHTHEKYPTQEKIGINGVPVYLINCCVEQNDFRPFEFDEIKAKWDTWVKNHPNRNKILTHILRNKNAK